MTPSNYYGQQFSLVTAPSGMVVSMADLKAHLRYTASDRDDLLLSLQHKAVEVFQRETRRQLLTATYDLILDHFETEIQIRKCPVQSITSISYLDTDGQSQTVSGSVYDLTPSTEPAVVRLKYSQQWPPTQSIHNAVTVRFVAGYGAAAAVPEIAKQCIRLMVESDFLGMEDRLQSTIDRLIANAGWSL